MNYLLLEYASDDLEQIEDWVASMFGEASAIRATKKLNDIFKLLVAFQKMGIERTDITSRPVRFFCTGQNWIVYEPGAPSLIYRIFPASQDITTLRL